MASLSDIPNNLLDKDRSLAYFDWLFAFPLPDHTRQEITQQWCYATGADPQVTFAMLNTRILDQRNAR